MHEFTSIIMNSFHLFLYFFLCLYTCFIFLNKWVIQKLRCLCREDGGSLKSEQKGTEAGGGEGRRDQAYLHVQSVKKVSWFFKQQTEFFLIGCLANFSCFVLRPAYKSVFLLNSCTHFLICILNSCTQFFMKMKIF